MSSMLNGVNIWEVFHGGDVVLTELVKNYCGVILKYLCNFVDTSV